MIAKISALKVFKRNRYQKLLYINLKLVSTIFITFLFFHQMIALQKL